MTPHKRRRIAALLLATLLIPALFVHDRGMRFDHLGRIGVMSLHVPASAAAGLGPFRLAGAWQLDSGDVLFGGYSALLARPGGRLLAISDRGGVLDLREPPLGPAPFAMAPLTRAEPRSFTDAEAATTGPSGQIWISWEDGRAIGRLEPGLGRERRVFPRAMKDWSLQFAGESLVRLKDGRFLITAEAFLDKDSDHQTLTFASDPAEGAVNKSAGTVAPTSGVLHMATGYRPTDMAQLPDGRILVLMRKMIWPLPMRFSCRIAIADPAELARTGQWTARDLARLDPPLPTDNFEGIAVRPRADGKVDVWVISDDNRASTQRTLLLKLELDPAHLPTG
jgi:hypothetical protein